MKIVYYWIFAIALIVLGFYGGYSLSSKKIIHDVRSDIVVELNSPVVKITRDPDIKAYVSIFANGGSVEVRDGIGRVLLSESWDAENASRTRPGVSVLPSDE